jgi:translocation and assembly module TamA
MRGILPRICLLIFISLCGTAAARAADPQAYDVDFASTGDGSMDATLRATSELLSLRSSAPVSPFGLIARARGEIERLKTVMESFGYYQSAATIKIEGFGLNDPGLADALTALSGRNARVSVAFTLGPLYHLRKVSVDGALPASAQGAFTLKSGAPAVAADVLAAGAQVLTALQEQGYAFAKVDPPIAYEDAHDPVLDVSFHVDAGARVKIGEITIKGLQRVHEKLVRHRLLLHPGDQFSPSALERARRDLSGLGPFAAINVEIGAAADASGGVPITFVVRERPRHAVTLNGAYSSDLGGSGTVIWSDRNVLGNAEQLVISASVINLGGGSSTTGTGYDTSAKFIKPDFGHRDQSLQFSIGAIKQSLQAYDQTAATSGVTLNRKLSSLWTASAGLTAVDEHVIQEGTTYNYTLVSLPLTVSYDSTNLASPLDDPLHGMRDSLSIAPTEALGHPNASFIITQIKLAAYFDLHRLVFTDPGRTVLAVRALAGLAQGAGEFSLPPDQRFYGGGSGTIRGYPYQFVGPKFPDHITPIGGTAITAGTLELRQRFGKNFGAAVFLDGGQVSASLKPLHDQFRFGAGAGIRYYTPIGPIRVDIAVPTSSYSYDPDAFEIYVGLGQAF